MSAISPDTILHTKITPTSVACTSSSERLYADFTKNNTAKNDSERPHSSTQEIVIKLFREKWEQKRNTRVSRAIFRCWKRLAHLRSQETMAVIERYNWYTKQKFFIAWIEGVLMAKRERQLELEAEASLMELAVRENEKRLLRHYFYAWLVINRLEKVNKLDSAAEATVSQQSREFIQQMTRYREAEQRSVTANHVVEEEEKEVDRGVHENNNAENHTFSSRKQTFPRRSAWSARLSKTQARHERAQVGSLSSQLALQAELMAKDMTEEALKRAAVEQEKRAMQTAKRAVKEEALERRRDALSTESTIVNTSSCSSRQSSSARSNLQAASTFFISPASGRSYTRFQRSDEVLKQVELRKLKRLQLMEQYEERRDRIRREKLNQLRADAEKVERELKEERRRKMQELKERQRCEAEKKQRMEALQERQRQLNKLATNGRIYLLQKFYGFLPWIRYVESQRKNTQVADMHNTKRFLRCTFQAWSARALRVQEEKNKKAVTLFQSSVCRRFFFAWIEVTTGRRLLFQAAVCHYEITLIRRIFLAWVESHTDCVHEDLIKQRMADYFCRRSSENRCFKAWRKYLPIIFAERALQQRLAKYREKVRLFLPDFASPQAEIEEALS
uniref:Coiled-coil domain-containing protein KIAA1407 n=3 Tax=Schistocephalus solidus TaxID=70667 RepID=A0A0X3PGK6_SCHSO